MDDSKKRESPEARLQREVLAARERDAARAHYKGAQAAEAVKTARLRALRLARDAAILQEAAAAKAGAAKAKAARAGASKTKAAKTGATKAKPAKTGLKLRSQ